MDTILTMLAAAGVTYVMGVPGADDVMLNYQSTSFHDALFVREAFGLKHAPEFEAWLAKMTITDQAGRLLPVRPDHPLIADASRAEAVRP
jgi:ethanolamine ammonia-lyase large subunit